MVTPSSCFGKLIIKLKTQLSFTKKKNKKKQWNTGRIWFSYANLLADTSVRLQANQICLLNRIFKERLSTLPCSDLSELYLQDIEPSAWTRPFKSPVIDESTVLFWGDAGFSFIDVRRINRQTLKQTWCSLSGLLVYCDATQKWRNNNGCLAGRINTSKHLKTVASMWTWSKVYMICQVNIKNKLSLI